ncbi:MAG: response regulator, partial [Thiobacillaceae bacterium]
GPRRVLLADADPQRLHLLANVLRRQGYQICTVSDGEKARGRMDKERFDLVVCGLDLPLVDGRQLYTWARAKRPEMARRLVFIVSGEVSTELEAFLQVARAWVLLPPFQEDAVRAVIGQALQTALQAADVT